MDNYSGNERGKRQTYLNELLGCYGTHRNEVAEFEDAHTVDGIMDMHMACVGRYVGLIVD